MTAKERIEDAGYDDVVVFDNFSYDDALVGISSDNRAVYDFDAMVDWLERTEDMSQEEAIEWIEYNTLRALPYAGPDGPIVVKYFTQLDDNILGHTD